jgi:lipopolysaccharide export system protein LptC
MAESRSAFFIFTIVYAPVLHKRERHALNDPDGTRQSVTDREPSADRAHSEAMWTEPRPRHIDTQRHSRFVSRMKVILPAAAVLILVLIMAWPHLQMKDNRFRIGFTTLKLTGSQDKSMVNPRFLGTDKKTKPFTVTADLAKNVIADETMMELEMPKADMTLEDGSWLVLTANTGVYDKEKKMLALRTKVNLFHDSGYEFRTSVADVDLTKGLAEGDQPVTGQGPFGSLKSEGFRLIDKGRIIYFTGKAKLIMYPEISQSLKKRPAVSK